MAASRPCAGVPAFSMVRMSVPSASKRFRDSAVAISPVEIMAITEAMPIMMPMRPSSVRSLAP